MKNTILDISKKIIDGFLAGMLITLGGSVFLACNADEMPFGKYIGAFFFSTALLCICIKGFSLYTGKIGYVLSKHKKEDISVLLLGLLGNAIATIAIGYLFGATFPQMKETALTLCNAKLTTQGGLGFSLVRAILCGLLVYLAVDIYRANHTVIGVLLCIPVFILSGYEHSIADMFYFAASGMVSWNAFAFLMIIILGNSLGALIIPALQLVKPQKKAEISAETESEDKAA